LYDLVNGIEINLRTSEGWNISIYGEIPTWVQEKGKRAIPKFLLLYK